MPGNANFHFNDVAIIAVEACEPPIVVTSTEIDERLAPFYERIGTPPGLLSSLVGIEERRQWPADISFMDAAVLAGEKALISSGISREKIGLIIDTSVCRERLEPSSAVTVHHKLGMPSTCINFDLSNACLGFVNGMHMAGAMLESKQIDYALIVDGEGTREISENTIQGLLKKEATFDDLFLNFASLTLGSGSAAMVIGRQSENPGSHSILGGFFHAASEHHDLCVGSLQSMRTDTSALLKAGTEVAKQAWEAGGPKKEWLEKDLYILHQVSLVHTKSMIDVLGLPSDKVPMTFPYYGNIGPAAIPITLANEQANLSPGDTLLCLGIGSGLNTALLELQW